MSDMVQQPVIQLVQDLTMTAVVEWNDCTDTKKQKLNQEFPGPVWIPIMHLVFLHTCQSHQTVWQVWTKGWRPAAVSAVWTQPGS